ncbi:MAG: glutamine--tRNA ligase, partial [Lawsonibacter sp.]|nr:glutamine--tRNA ligase [Lawsonibacter sp.]MCI9568249.1 glutamine--tRNA ligase [Lawsonibacter sp.]
PECRLKGAYLIKCVGYETDEQGNVTEIAAEYDPDSRGGDPADGRKVKGATIHWVDAATAVDAQVRLYDNLFADPDPDGGDKDFLDCLDPGSLEVLEGCKLEASLAAAQPADRFQFLRLGYFCADSKDSKPGALVFNRAVSLKDGFKAGK